MDYSVERGKMELYKLYHIIHKNTGCYRIMKQIDKIFREDYYKRKINSEKKFKDIWLNKYFISEAMKLVINTK